MLSSSFELHAVAMQQCFRKRVHNKVLSYRTPILYRRNYLSVCLCASGHYGNSDTVCAFLLARILTFLIRVFRPYCQVNPVEVQHVPEILNLTGTEQSQHGPTDRQILGTAQIFHLPQPRLEEWLKI